MQDSIFSAHNLHLESIELFENQDPQLSRLKKSPYCYESALIQDFPFDIPGIYSVGGGRQVGKSTLLKQWMLFLLKEKIPPQNITYLTGEVIEDQHRLLNLVQTIVRDKNKDPKKSSLLYLLIDEVTYIKDWDKGIKFLADAGFLENVVLMITGSELTFIQEARMRFPGRRGKSDQVDFHLYPLSFREFLHLTSPTLTPNLAIDPSEISQKVFDLLDIKFSQYLLHGGYLTAINDFALSQELSISTLNTYSDWIRGDMLKRGKQERYLREIFTGVFKHYGSQITWNGLSKSLSIDHPSTVADYLLLLEMMDALFIQYALLEDKLTGAPKKARKVIFTDPFIYHAAWHWISGETPSLEKIQTQPIFQSQLVEAVCISHCRRYFPTYFIHAEGEVDIAYIQNNIFHPIEIKWTEQIRSKDLKQILKYKNGQIWSKQTQPGAIENTPISNLILNLAKI